MKGLLGCCEYKEDGWVKLVLENITKKEGSITIEYEEFNELSLSRTEKFLEEGA